MRGALLVALGLTCVPAASNAGAQWLELPISDVRVLSDGIGHVRILLGTGDLATLEGKFVEAALLTVPVDGEAFPRDLDLRVFPVTQAWEGGPVDWTTPWSEPGGDFDERRMCAEQVSAGRRSTALQVNVSPIIREMVHGSIESHGFLLGVARHHGAGFDPEELARFGSMEGLMLRVKVRQGGRWERPD